MRASFTIPERMPGLNEYTSANRRHPKAGASMKGKWTQLVAWQARASGLPRFKRPVHVRFRWVEPVPRGRAHARDYDNIRFAAKFVMDGLVMAGVLEDDGPSCVVGFSDTFAYDDKARVEVEISDEG